MNDTVRRVLIISPRFPPINAPDLHRIRHSLPYFESTSWVPEVWRVTPDRTEEERDPRLVETVPDWAQVHSVNALDPRWTRKVGLGSIALRSLPFYWFHGTRRLQEGDVDLVYFSTTAFPVTILGAYWKRTLGIPYVIDMQDPWFTNYYVGKPKEEQPPKFWFSHRLDKYLEPVAMRDVSAIISVSQGYCETLQERYENIEAENCKVIPFGAAEFDYGVVDTCDVDHTCFTENGDRTINVVYAGVVPPAMEYTVRAICQALRMGLERQRSLYDRVHLHFVGTSYAPDAEKTVEPIASEYGLEGRVHEQSSRIPYFEALSLLRDADQLLVLGTDDPQYTASKLYPYILAERPLLAVFHRNSSVVDVLEETCAGRLACFSTHTEVDVLAHRVYREWTPILEALPYRPNTDWEAFRPYTAEAMAERQIEVFDRVLAANRRNGSTCHH